MIASQTCVSKGYLGAIVNREVKVKHIQEIVHLEEVEVASEIKVLSGGITNSAVAIDPVVRQCKIGPK